MSHSNGSTKKALMIGGAVALTGAALYAGYRVLSSSASPDDDIFSSPTTKGGASAFSPSNNSGSSGTTASTVVSNNKKSTTTTTVQKRKSLAKYPYSVRHGDFPWGSDPTADKVESILAAMAAPIEEEGRRLSEQEETKLMAELTAALTAMRAELCGYEKPRLPPTAASSPTAMTSMKGTAGEAIESSIGELLAKKKDAADDAAAAADEEEENLSDSRYDPATLRKRRVFAATLSDAAQGVIKLGRVKEAGELFFEACNAFRSLAHKNPNRDESNTPESIGAKELESIKHEDVLHAACLTSRGSFLEDLTKKKEALLCHKAAVDICFLLFDQASIKRSMERQSGGGPKKKEKEDEEENSRLDHPIFARALNNMGALLFNMQQHEAGMRMLTDALTMRRRLAGGLDTPDLAESMTNLGMILVRSPNKTEEGMNLMSVACEIYRRCQGGLPSQVLAQNENALGGALIQCGSQLQFAIREMEAKIQDSQQSKMAMMQQQKAMAEAASEMIGDGMQYKISAVETLRKFSNGRPDPALVAVLTEVGGAFGMLGQRAKALEFKMEAMQIAEKLYGGDDSDDSDSYQLATTYYSVGITLIGVDKKEEGIARLRKALGIMRRLIEKPAGKSNVELQIQLANNMKVLGVSLDNVGEKEEGVALQKEAEALKNELQAQAESRSAASAALSAAAGVGSM